MSLLVIGAIIRAARAQCRLQTTFFTDLSLMQVKFFKRADVQVIGTSKRYNGFNPIRCKWRVFWRLEAGKGFWERLRSWVGWVPVFWSLVWLPV